MLKQENQSSDQVLRTYLNVRWSWQLIYDLALEGGDWLPRMTCLIGELSASLRDSTSKE